MRTLRQAARAFAGYRSPRIILPAILAVVALRVLLGGLGWGDVVAAALMLAVFSFGEWTIHVYLLHVRPVRGRRLETGAAREHRRHHERPNDLTLILLGPREIAQLFLLAVPFTVAIGVLISRPLAGPPSAGAVITALVVGYILVGLYEWTHFLIHTAYRPRSRYYRSIWRSHRLHHFKNEHFWHGVTSNVSDRFLGTFPDQGEVPRSPTARTLEP